MKPWIALPFLLFVCAGLQAKNVGWQPSAGHTQMPIWPGTPPDAQPVPAPEYAVTGTSAKSQFAGKPVTGIHDVSRPTMTIYSPTGKNTGAAVVVFPGGGFEVLAIDLEGTEACDWLVSRHHVCPAEIPSPERAVRLALQMPCRRFRASRACAGRCPEDAEAGAFPRQGMAHRSAQDRRARIFRRRLSRGRDQHEFQAAPVSAGGCSRQRKCPSRFRDGHLPGTSRDRRGQVESECSGFREVPPTFLVQAEDDYTDGVNQSLVYYTALAKARVPAEMHLYAHGGHAFGLRRTQLPITRWPQLAEAWLRTIGVLAN